MLVMARHTLRDEPMVGIGSSLLGGGKYAGEKYKVAERSGRR